MVRQILRYLQVILITKHPLRLRTQRRIRQVLRRPPRLPRPPGPFRRRHGSLGRLKESNNQIGFSKLPRGISYMTTFNDCIKYLEIAGWMGLIDPKWRRQIEKELRECFEDELSEETLKEVLDVVLIENVELPEDEYKYIQPIPEEVSNRFKH